MPCDRYGPWHILWTYELKSWRIGRIRVQLSFFTGVSNLVRCDYVACRVQVRTNQNKVCTRGSGWNLGAQEAFAGVWDRKWGR
jgi:hypothetical protein